MSTTSIAMLLTAGTTISVSGAAVVSEIIDRRKNPNPVPGMNGRRPYCGNLAVMFLGFAAVAGWYAGDIWGDAEATASLCASVLWTTIAIGLLVYRKST